MDKYHVVEAQGITNLDPTLEWFDVVMHRSSGCGEVVAIVPTYKWAQRIANALNQMEIE